MGAVPVAFRGSWLEDTGEWVVGGGDLVGRVGVVWDRRGVDLY